MLQYDYMEQMILLSLLVVAASAVGTFSGFGMSTIMVPVLLFFFPLPTTLLFVGIIHWFGDIWKILLFAKGARHWKLILWFAIPGVAASIAGAFVSIQAPQEILLRVLGAFLLLYVTFLFAKPKWKLPQKNSVAASGGLVSGFAAGIFGVGGAIRASVLAAFNLPKEVYLFTSGFTALFIDFSRVASYVAGGTQLQDVLLWGLLLFIPLSFLGAWLAKKFVNRVPQQYFRFAVAVFLAAAGLKFLLFP